MIASAISLRASFPAILTREILLRRSPLRQGKWLNFLSIAVCLAFSASYELIEWATAIATGEAATAFLGTQGDPWDTQWDMFLALLGACRSDYAKPDARQSDRAPTREVASVPVRAPGLRLRYVGSTQPPPDHRPLARPDVRRACAASEESS